MALPTVLVVDVDDNARRALASALQSLPCVVETAATFAEARALIADLHPAIAVARLKLHEYNSIHLALLARTTAPETQVIILGPADPVLSREALAAGAVYCADATHAATVAAVETALTRVTRRWPRAPVALEAQSAGERVRIVDVSYTGVRIEAPMPRREPQTAIPLTIGSLQLDATLVWSKPANGNRVWYGATLATSPEQEHAWRALVDAAFTSAGREG